MPDFDKLWAEKKAWCFRVKIVRNRNQWIAHYAVSVYFFGRCQMWCVEKYWRNSMEDALMDAVNFVFMVNHDYDIFRHSENIFLEYENEMG